MKKITKDIGIFLLLIALWSYTSCHKTNKLSSPPPNNDTTHQNTTIDTTAADNDSTHQGTLPVFPDDLPPLDNSVPTLTITWEKQAKKISTGESYNASYPRVHKLNERVFLMTYLTSSWGGFHGNVIIRKSMSAGRTWSDPREIVKYDPDKDASYFGFKNPDFIVLHNGWILLAYVGVGRTGFNSDIQIIFSKDGGNTWTSPKIVHKGYGIWEPAMVQLPDGTIDLFFSSEEKWFKDNNVQQEILMISSKDLGSTWSEPITAAYSPGNRDGMAVPLLLKDNKGIIFPIESPGQIMPWMIWSSVKANFYYKSFGTKENGRRWYINPPSLAAPGGAPYIVRLSTGETLLNVQAAGGRNLGGQWKKSTQIVLVGNSVGKNFTNASVAWPDLGADEGTYFSSICLLDDSTILMPTTRYLSNEHSEVWTKIGHIHR